MFAPEVHLRQRKSRKMRIPLLLFAPEVHFRQRKSRKMRIPLLMFAPEVHLRQRKSRKMRIPLLIIAPDEHLRQRKSRKMRIPLLMFAPDRQRPASGPCVLLYHFLLLWYNGHRKCILSNLFRFTPVKTAGLLFFLSFFLSFAPLRAGTFRSRPWSSLIQFHLLSPLLQPAHRHNNDRYIIPFSLNTDIVSSAVT